MKTNAIIRIIVWSVLLLILLGIFLGALAFSWSDSFWWDFIFSDTQMLASDAPVLVSANTVQALNIDLDRCNITMLPGDVDSIAVINQSSEDAGTDVYWGIRQNELILRAKSDWGGFGLLRRGSPRIDLSIVVPRDWICQELDADAASIWLEATDLTIREADLDSASVMAKMENCTVTDLSVDTASGNVTFQGSLETLDWDGASGDFIGELTNTPRQVDVDSASGKLELTLPRDSGFTVLLDTASGDFISDFETRNSGEEHVYGDGRCVIDVDSASGDVIVHKGKR